jgi:TRAP-type uncharacterized transport system substrate-binding protein
VIEVRRFASPRANTTGADKGRVSRLEEPMTLTAETPPPTWVRAMHRRQILRLASLGMVGLSVMGHSPYRQWHVFRKSRLIIVVSAADGPAVDLARALASLLATHLPESRAMMARAPDPISVAKLLASRQLDVALLSSADAQELFQGTGPFAEDGAVPLRALAAAGDHLVVCRDDFAPQRAREIAQALADHWTDAEPLRTPRADAGEVRGRSIPWHPAVVEYYESRASTR